MASVDTYFNKICRFLDETPTSISSRDKDGFSITEIKYFIKEIIDNNKEHLLTDYYLLYITHDKYDENNVIYNSTDLMLDRIRHHLFCIFSDNPLIVLKELYGYNKYLSKCLNESHYGFKTPEEREKLEFKELLKEYVSTNQTKYDNLMEIKAFGYKNGIIDAILCGEGFDRRFEVLEKIFFAFLSVSDYYNIDFNTYLDYLKQVYENLDSYFDELELNGIIKREIVNPLFLRNATFRFTIIENKYMEYLYNHLNNGLVENSSNKEIK